MECDTSSSSDCPDHRCTLGALGWVDWLILLIMASLVLGLALLFKLFIIPLFRKAEVSNE